MSTDADAGLAQDRGAQQPAEPGRVLQHGKLVPCASRATIVGSAPAGRFEPGGTRATVEPRVFVPVEIVDHRTLSWPPPRPGRLAFSIMPSDRASILIDGGIVDAEEMMPSAVIPSTSGSIVAARRMAPIVCASSVSAGRDLRFF